MTHHKHLSLFSKALCVACTSQPRSSHHKECIPQSFVKLTRLHDGNQVSEDRKLYQPRIVCITTLCPPIIREPSRDSSSDEEYRNTGAYHVNKCNIYAQSPKRRNKSEAFDPSGRNTDNIISYSVSLRSWWASYVWILPDEWSSASSFQWRTLQVIFCKFMPLIANNFGASIRRTEILLHCDQDSRVGGVQKVARHTIAKRPVLYTR
jgi:hypothetical protein